MHRYVLQSLQSPTAQQRLIRFCETVLAVDFNHLAEHAPFFLPRPYNYNIKDVEQTGENTIGATYTAVMSLCTYLATFGHNGRRLLPR